MSGHTGYYAYVPESHEAESNLNILKFKKEKAMEEGKAGETKESLEEMQKALEIVQAFAIKHWKPCLRDCCADAMHDVEDMLEELQC